MKDQVVRIPENSENPPPWERAQQRLDEEQERKTSKPVGCFLTLMVLAIIAIASASFLGLCLAGAIK